MKKYYDIAEFKILNIINFVIEKEFNMFEMHKHMDRLKSIKVYIHDFGEIKPDSSMSFEIPETICSEYSYEKNNSCIRHFSHHCRTIRHHCQS